MTPEIARDMVRRQMLDSGETVTLKRGATQADTLGKLRQPTADELIDTIDQTQQRAMILADDLETAAFPLPPKKNDRLLVGGKELFVEQVDETTKRVAGVVVAYDLVVVG